MYSLGEKLGQGPQRVRWVGRQQPNCCPLATLGLGVPSERDCPLCPQHGPRDGQWGPLQSGVCPRVAPIQGSTSSMQSGGEGHLRTPHPCLCLLTSFLLKYFRAPSLSVSTNFRLKNCPLSRPRFQRRPSRYPGREDTVSEGQGARSQSEPSLRRGRGPSASWRLGRSVLLW